MLRITLGLLIAVLLSPRFASAGFPSCEESQATADYSSLCPASAGDSLHVLIELRDAFTAPADLWVAFVRCASPAGGPAFPSLAPSNHLGFACVSTTVGAVIGAECCDSLEVGVYDALGCTFPVTVGMPPVSEAPVGALSLATAPTDLLTSGGSAQEIRIAVDLRGPCGEPIVGWPADSVCADCGSGSGPVCADGVSGADGRSVISTTIGQLTGSQPCPDLQVRVCGAPTTCVAPVSIVPTDVAEPERSRSALRLEPGTPNPFHAATSLRYSLPAPVDVRLTVYDARGRRVRILVDRPLPAGEHLAAWDGRSADGSSSPSGVYFVRLEAGGEARTRKLSLRH